MTHLKGHLAMGTALVLCPCHLPILAAVLGGTVLGATITENLALVIPVTAVAFIGALFLGLRWIMREEALACTTCEAPNAAPAATERQVSHAIAEPSGVRENQPVGGDLWK